jgi:hypothetical protein
VIYTRTYQQLTGQPKPGRDIGRVSHVVWHHEAGHPLPASATVAQEEARFRAIDQFHRGLGWGGFAYAAMICQSGRIYEGRGWRRSGTHTVGFNTTALGVMIPGNGDTTPMSAQCVDAGRRWLQAGVAGGHLSAGFRLTGHRDHALKSCPGVHIYRQLPSLLQPVPQPVEEDVVKPEDITAIAKETAATLRNDPRFLEAVERQVWGGKEYTDPVTGGAAHPVTFLRFARRDAKAALDAATVIARRVDEVATSTGTPGPAAERIVDEIARRLAE